MKNKIIGYFVLLPILLMFPCISMGNEIFGKNLKNDCYDLNNFINTTIVSGDNVYVNSKNIYVSKHQIYLKVGNKLLPIQHLSSDINGVFVSMNEMIDFIELGASRKTWICPKKGCDYENYVGIDYCALCGTHRYAKK